MPLININQNQHNGKQQSQPAGANSFSQQQPYVPSQIQQVEQKALDSNMPLSQPVTVRTNEQGITEYSPATDTRTTQPTQSIDLKQNLDNKLDTLQQTHQTIGDQIKQRQEAVPSLTSQNMSLEQILDKAIENEASDIHLTVGYRPMIRVDGSLRTLAARENTEEELLQYAHSIAHKRSDITLDTVKQVDLSFTYRGRRFRVNIFKMMGNFSIVARMIPATIRSIDELELPQILKQLANVPSGLVLLTGPTGSGKSTTLAAVLNFINATRAEHIITLEDPIEFVFPKGQSLIDQRELGQDFDTWTDALRSILRQDPNVVLVGEMRDFDTIASTITVSETGHLVFATLHTNSAAQTIDRIIDVFPDSQQEQIRAQLAQVLTAVIAQRLVPLPNGGRKAVHEIMIATPAVKNAIREGQTHQLDNMIQTGQTVGMISMEKSLVQLVQKGLISVETAKEVSIKPDEMDILLSQF